MNVKEADSSVVAKPVASRPSCSTYKSFSDLLAGAINASPSETAIIPAIRPKMVRFNPTLNPSVTGLIPSQDPPDHSKLLNGKSTSMVYKPLAKVVSKTTVSLLASMGNFNNNSLKQIQPTAENKAQRTPSTQSIETPKRHHSQDEETKPAPPMGNSERASFDGYNWRKYGQKQVKGSEYPRSYYKCTHPSCPVKKKVERSLDGQIAEIVYKGEHNHSKPQPAKRSGSSSVVPESANNQGAYNTHNQNDSDYSYRGVKASQPCGSAPTPAAQNSDFIDSKSTGAGVEPEEESKGIEAEEGEPRSSKRRKSEKQSNGAGLSREGMQDSKVVQNSSDPEVSSDGFRWRKYGQKVVKGNPYPRSYYRCTSNKCNVRKHVERASDDPKAFITTYEGKHNHDMPVRNPNSLSLSSHTDHTSTT